MAAVSAKLAANAGANKVGSMVEGVKDSLSRKKDPENPNQVDEEEEDSDPFAITAEDLWKNPCLFIPVLIFSTGGCLGLIFFLVFLVAGEPSSNYGGVFLGIFLGVVGIWAGFEVWALGSLKDQINRLKGIRTKLADDTNKLGGEVGELEAENAELEENVTSLKEQNDELEDKVKQFDTKNEELRNLSSGLEKQNSELKDNVSDLEGQNQQLDSTMSKMSTEFEELNTAMKSFDELREKLNMISEQTGEDMSELIEKTKDTYKRMDQLVRDNEEILLNQLAADVEMMDNGMGISEREFKRFRVRLPKRYKQILEEENLDFQSFDPNGDGNIDTQELKDLIKNLVDKNEEKEAKKREPSTQDD